MQDIIIVGGFFQWEMLDIIAVTFAPVLALVILFSTPEQSGTKFHDVCFLHVFQ